MSMEKELKSLAPGKSHLQVTDTFLLVAGAEDMLDPAPVVGIQERRWNRLFPWRSSRNVEFHLR